MSNVRDFGAMGDGLADDTGAIEHALQDGGDGVLEFPRGEYRVTRTITFNMAKTGRIAIHGCGGAAKLVMHGPGPIFEFIGHHGGSADPNSFKPEVWQSERMPTVSQIEIEGKHAEADGIRFNGIMQPTLTGVLIRKVRNAVHVTQRCRNVLISHCHIYHNTGIGIWLDRVNLHQTNIVGNHISYNRLGGIRIEESEVRNLQITGNDIEYNNFRAFNRPEDADVATAEIYIDCSRGGTVREGTISSNTIQATYSPNGANIRFIGGASEHSHLTGMWTISGNLIGSQETNIHLTLARGITIEGNYVYSGHHRNLLAEECQNLVIGANCFGHNPDYKDKELCTGIRLENCQNCTLTGLQIQDALAGEHTVAGVKPIQRNGLIELSHCERILLTGVQVLEGSPYALFVEDCSETMINGCAFLETRPQKQTQASIHWTGAGRNNSIAHCRMNRGVQAPEHVRLSDNLLGD